MSSKQDSTIDTLASDSLDNVNGGVYNPRAFFNNRFNWARGNWARRAEFRTWERTHNWRWR